MGDRFLASTVIESAKIKCFYFRLILVQIEPPVLKKTDIELNAVHMEEKISHQNVVCHQSKKIKVL